MIYPKPTHGRGWAFCDAQEWIGVPLPRPSRYRRVRTPGAAPPIRKPEHTSATVDKVVEPTEAGKKDGVLVTSFLKDRKAGVVIKKRTAGHKQMGKLVPVAEATDITVDSKVSVRVDAKTDVAEGVLIFP